MWLSLLLIAGACAGERQLPSESETRPEPPSQPEIAPRRTAPLPPELPPELPADWASAVDFSPLTLGMPLEALRASCQESGGRLLYTGNRHQTNITPPHSCRRLDVAVVRNLSEVRGWFVNATLDDNVTKTLSAALHCSTSSHRRLDSPRRVRESLRDSLGPPDESTESGGRTWQMSWRVSGGLQLDAAAVTAPSCIIQLILHARDPP